MAISRERGRTSSKYVYYTLQLTFQPYHFEKHHKGYLNSSKESMFPFGIGSSVTSGKRY
jgi:hypothetical protein